MSPWMWGLLLTACGPSAEDSAPLDPYTMPSVAGCRLDETATLAHNGETYQWDTWAYDDEERVILRESTENQDDVTHLAAAYDDDGCRTLYVDQALEGGVVVGGWEIPVLCEDGGTRSHGEGVHLYMHEPLALTFDGSTEYDDGLPVVDTLLYTREDGEVWSERWVWGWLDGEMIQRDHYEDDLLARYERWDLDEAGRPWRYTYGTDDYELYTFYEYDEHGRPIRQTGTFDAEGLQPDDEFRITWSDAQYTPISATYDYTAGDSDGVDYEITYDCSEGWPWSCTATWFVAGFTEPQTILQSDWSCEGATTPPA